MNGFINLLKPPGITSQSAVSLVRRLLGVRKAGHTGTLDPGAAGVLPVCIGRATKLARFVVDGTKEYIAELTLGARTDTLDSYGTVLERCEPRPVSEEDVRKAAARLTGEIRQRPPAYSAVKVDGRPLYRYARSGENRQADTRLITVDSFVLMRGYGRGPFVFQITCTKGTYVRVLLEDLARSLGQIGYTSFLERTRVGAFEVQGAVTFGEIEQQLQEGNLRFLVPPQDAVSGQMLELPPYLYDILISGAGIVASRVRGLHLSQEQVYRVFCRDEFFGMGAFDGTTLTLCARVHL